MAANFEFTGGLECRQEYRRGEAAMAYVFAAAATYKSPVGSRLAMDLTLQQLGNVGRTPAVWYLAAGVEQMRSDSDENDVTIYIQDANLFVQIYAGFVGDKAIDAGAATSLLTAVESFADDMVQKLRRLKRSSDGT